MGRSESGSRHGAAYGRASLQNKQRRMTVPLIADADQFAELCQHIREAGTRRVRHRIHLRTHVSSAPLPAAVRDGRADGGRRSAGSQRPVGLVGADVRRGDDGHHARRTGRDSLLPALLPAGRPATSSTCNWPRACAAAAIPWAMRRSSAACSTSGFTAKRPARTGTIGR